MAITVRKSFEEQLQELQDDLLRMGRFVEGAVAKAMKALVAQDIALANEVIREDDIADDLDVEIETKAMKLLALQQPMARDLRIIGTALKIVTDLERIGDHAVDIAKLARLLAHEPFFKPLVDIPKLAQLSLNMVHGALQAYVNRDLELAIQVCRDDDQVDELYESLFAELVDYMKRDPLTGRTSHLPALRRLLSGAHRRPRHQHGGAGLLHGDRAFGTTRPQPPQP
jgi:phosphate transport system protein